MADHTQHNRRHNVARRVGWALMAAAHLPGLIASWTTVAEHGVGSDQVGGCTFLTLSMIFFGLKVADVAWLRLHTDRRSLVAFCVVIGILHFDVLRHHGDPSGLPEYTALVGSTCLLSTLLPVRRLFHALALHFSANPNRLSRLARSADSVWLDAFHPHCWTLILRLIPPRAPPV